MRRLLEFASRLRRLLDARPRTPFVIAVAVALLVLLAAVDWSPVAADRDRQVDEIAVPGPDMDDVDERIHAEADWIDEVEFGHSLVTGPDGEPMLAVAARFANPDPDGYLFGSIAVTATDEHGNDEQVAVIFIGRVPPGGERRIGTLQPVEDVDPALLVEGNLRIEPAGLSLQAVDDDDPWLNWVATSGPAPEATLTAVDDLYVPPGVRLEYRIESPAEEERHLSMIVFFRAADGRLLGGMPFDATARYDAELSMLEVNTPVSVPPGTSTRHLDLRYEEIPAGADLAMTEIAFQDR